MSTYPLSMEDSTADSHNAHIAQWEAEAQRTRRRMFKLGMETIARLWRIDLEFDNWTTDLQLAERLGSFHYQCQALQLASPLDGKVCLQTETAARWVERDAYAQNPHQWDSDGQVWVSAAVDCSPLATTLARPAALCPHYLKDRRSI